jgi:hypothetical protein
MTNLAYRTSLTKAVEQQCRIHAGPPAAAVL